VPPRFEIGLTADGFLPDGRSIFGDLALDRLDGAGVSWRILPKMTDPIDPELIQGLDGVLAFGHLKFDRALALEAPRLSLVARFGAGYDGIDLDGLARAGVMVTNTPIAVRKPMAMVAITFVLALGHQLLSNHRAVVSGAWAAERGHHRGLGVQNRVLGIVGFGGIGEELCDLAHAIGLSVVASEHPNSRDRAAARGIPMVPLYELAATSDYVVVSAPLNDQTRHLIDARFFDAMKSTAYLVNIARGEVVDTVALRRAVLTGLIAGAGLDVYDPEPPASDDPLLACESVLLSPHCLAWTDDFTTVASTSVIESIVDAANGRRPRNVLNPSVFDNGWRVERGLHG
jgi:phosphoglycerate dehydrogenase-like enzyme